MEDNNTEKAIEILNEGLKEYPDYAAAHFILGRAYTIIGEYAKALKSFKKGSELIHSSKSYDYYLRELENIKKQPSLSGTNRYSTSFISDKPGAKQENKDTLLKEDKNLPVDDRLGELAQEFDERIKFAKVDIDVEGNKDLAVKYGVMSVPTLIIFSNGEVKETMVGVTSKSKLKQKLEPLL